MKKLVLICLAWLSTITMLHANPGDTLSLTLDEAINLAQRKSLNAFLAKNTYLEGYWNYRSYKATWFPSLQLNSFAHNYSAGYVWDRTNEEFDYRQNLTNEIELGVKQNIFLTGGNISVNSRLYRYRRFKVNDYQEPLTYNTDPFSIRLTQPLNGYNALKWNKRLRPLEYEITKRNYIREQQTIAQQTVQVFFNLVASQMDLTIANFNYSNADTLYRIGKGRFEIGTITQDEMLDLELSMLNAKTTLTKAQLSVQRSQGDLNSFLRLSESSTVKCIVPKEIPKLQIEVDKAVELAFENNPQVLSLQRSLLVSKRDVAKARSARYNASLQLNYGMGRTYNSEEELYNPPYESSEGARLALSMPLIDWGKSKGEYLMAKSQNEITKYKTEQSLIDFERNVVNTILEFNLQKQQVGIAQKADTIGQLGFEVTKQRFLIGKLDVIRLNSARNSMVSATKSYIRSLENYWSYYYSIQRLTLFDFKQKQALKADFEKIIDEHRLGN